MSLELEPKTKASIITRPCYDSNGKIQSIESPRFIGEIYVYGKRVFQSIDYDGEGTAFNACTKHILRYQRKNNRNFFLDAKMKRLIKD